MTIEDLNIQQSLHHQLMRKLNMICRVKLRGRPNCGADALNFQNTPIIKSSGQHVDLQISFLDKVEWRTDQAMSCLQSIWVGSFFLWRMVW
uniref:Uncharacterized protein n=1 Tax=Nelumbo nucifera TaxID=4432 RepID=A0A822XHJ8_NELNU|nr:TPA_asm: hypothetical protein HUJ06_019982 [Nelumbo nucifera]